MEVQTIIYMEKDTNKFYLIHGQISIQVNQVHKCKNKTLKPLLKK